MPFNLSVGELIVLLVVAVILFGGRLPEVARQIGLTFGKFKRGMGIEMSKLERELRTDLDVGRDILYTPAVDTEPTNLVPGQSCDDEDGEACVPPEDPEDPKDPEHDREPGEQGAADKSLPDEPGRT